MKLEVIKVVAVKKIPQFRKPPKRQIITKGWKILHNGRGSGFLYKSEEKANEVMNKMKQRHETLPK